VAEALLGRLGGAAVVCPVFPATGRTLFNGHLFVNGRLLSETGMRDHPLTPMTDPDVRRWLRLQTRGEVGLIPYAVVREGADAIRQALAREAESGRRLLVTDAVVDADLIDIGEAIAEHRLVTGGSGIALGLPANFRKAGLLSGKGTTFSGSSGMAAALSGSCSTQSLAQVETFAKSHPVLGVLPDAVMDRSMDAERAFDWAMERIGSYPMIYSSASPEGVKAAQQHHGRLRIAQAIEGFFGELAARLAQAGVTRLVIGGGETSGAVVTALKAKAFAIGPEINPGVPALTVEGSPLRLALKSGNFGSLDFYAHAARVLGRSEP
jgi:3-dehydrotetronate 4-kinase